jgi:spore maturation protein A
MNYLWGLMIVSGIVYAALTGTLPEVTQAAIDSSKEAVTLCITMVGVMSLWVGLMRIAEKAGIIAGAVRWLKPFLRFLFPGIPKEHLANQYIAENFIANVFGLGWAATPAGLRAMEELSKLEDDRRRGRLPGPVRKKGIASNEMCTFLIINISSLQLIPVNVIAYRSQYGSVNPAGIVGAGIVATAVSTIVAVVYCKMMDGKRRI